MDFQSKYDRKAYIDFFRNQFLPEDFEDTAEPIEIGFQPQYIKRVTKLGQVPSLDLILYEIKHNSENDPRVGLSKESFRLLSQARQNRALILFTSSNPDNYRLSLVTIDLAWEKGSKVQREYSNPKRFSFFLGPDCKKHTPEEYLMGKERVKDFEDLQNRFSIEVVNKEFYTQIALLFTKLTGGKRKIGSKSFDEGKGILELPGTSDETIKKEFAVRMIGRLVFCWFLKKKISTNNVCLIPEELLSAKSVKENKSYYHNVLEPLFFEVLNTPFKERNKKFKGKPWSQIPFLNGGLFTPHEHDFYELAFTGISKHINTLTVPDDWLIKLFEIFETYNFTIDENTPVDIELSIEPEMLGRIFENLLAEINPETGETARKATGSYYTPRPIVEYMVDESLKQYLLIKTKLPEDKLSVLLSYADEDEFELSGNEKNSVLDALDTIKIIDPACGSGAFPMGILQKILLVLQKIDPDSKKWLSRILAKIENATVRKELERKLKDASLDYIHKLGVIQSSIYGVDIQPIAVDVSKLRCFLSLIVDENVDDSKENRGIEPLPNLEFKFVCANTLIPLPTSKTHDNILIKDMYEDVDNIAKLKELRELYLTSYGKEKSKIEEAFKKVQSAMFDQTIKFKNVNVQTLALQQWKPFTDEPCPWFDPEWMFGIGDGFDLVIGNPPYIRVQNLSHDEIDLYKKLWSTAWKRIDICTLFFELACNILSIDGTGCYISSNQFLNTEYGRKTRDYFLDKAYFKQIVDFSDLPVFANQITYVSIFIFQKYKTEQIEYSKIDALPFVSDSMESCNIPIKLLNSDSWNLCNPQIKQFISNLSDNFYRLDSIAKSWAGIITGKDSVLLFKRKDPTLNKFEKELLLPVLRAEGCSRYCYAKPTRTTIYPYRLEGNETQIISEKELKEYKSVYSYLMQNKQALLSRKDSRKTMEEKKHWYGLVRHGNLNIFSQPKIVTPGEVKNNCFALDVTKSAFSCARVFAITISNDNVDLRYLLGILNSKLIEFYLHHTAAIKAGGYFSYSSSVLDSIPIPNNNKQKDIIMLVDKILSIKDASSEEKTEAYEEKINQIVYKLYGLTKEEIKMVEDENE